MGQKVSPHGLRVGVIKDWDSKWYGDKKHFAEFLAEDNKVTTERGGMSRGSEWRW